jgi:hypothetical protein
MGVLATVLVLWLVGAVGWLVGAWPVRMGALVGVALVWEGRGVLDVLLESHRL